MNPNRIVGIVLMVIGVTLLVIGLNASHSVADRLSDTFTGRFTQATTWYFIGGVGASALGLVLALAGGRGNKS